MPVPCSLHPFDYEPQKELSTMMPRKPVFDRDFRHALIWREPGSKYQHSNTVEKDQGIVAELHVFDGCTVTRTRFLHPMSDFSTEHID
ncbi:hypothetical protein TNCV_3431061 [Trichonephila clavipes]|nr:hypothetical protein TNCV_3431061 [Trichonephila clavipes]